MFYLIVQFIICVVQYEICISLSIVNIWCTLLHEISKAVLQGCTLLYNLVKHCTTLYKAVNCCTRLNTTCVLIGCPWQGYTII